MSNVCQIKFDDTNNLCNCNKEKNVIFFIDNEWQQRIECSVNFYAYLNVATVDFYSVQMHFFAKTKRPKFEVSIEMAMVIFNRNLKYI